MALYTNKLKLQVPTGTSDFLPVECKAKREIESKLRREFYLAGYDEIETPSFEYYDVFTNDAVPYVQENMIKFFDLSGRILALRPDITGPIARMASTKLLNKTDKLRLCYIGNAYGFSHKGINEKAEFTQAGVELIGIDGAKADAEVIALAIQSLLSVGVNCLKIDIGQVGFFKGLLEDTNFSEEDTEKIRGLINSKNSVDLDFFLQTTKTNENTKNSLKNLITLFGGKEVIATAKNLAKNEKCAQAINNLQEVYEILCEYGFKNYITIDLGILSDFNYYSGIIFRGITDGIGAPLLSGGRYGGLYKEFGINTTATGFAMGIKEILIILDKENKLKQNSEDITYIENKCSSEAFALATKLRQQNKRAVIK